MFSVPDDLPEDTKKRLPAIMKGVKQKKTNEQIAHDLGVSKYVVAHDRLLWRRSDGYEAWVFEEFQRLHDIVADQSPITGYKVMGQLAGRLITQKIKAEIKAQGRIKVDVEAGESIEDALKRYEAIIRKVVAETIDRDISEDGSGEQVDPAEAASETG